MQTTPIESERFHPQSVPHAWVAGAACLGWLGLTLELGARALHAHAAWPAINALISYFIMWTNLLEAVALTAGIRRPPGARTLTGLATAILIVALVFNLMLRAHYHPVGALWLASELLHVI